MPTRCEICGHDVGQPNKGRSVPQMRRYWAMIRAYWHHWPETAERQFESPEHMRKWLQMRAGHREVAVSMDLDGATKDAALLIAEAAIRATGEYAVPVLHGDALVIWRPKSIAFSRLGHSEACKLFDDVAAVAEEVTGLRADDVMRETEAAA